MVEILYLTCSNLATLAFNTGSDKKKQPVIDYIQEEIPGT